MGHQSKDCNRVCNNCRGPHARPLCDKAQQFTQYQQSAATGMINNQMQPAWLPVQSTAPQVPQLQVPPTHNTGVPISAQGWNSMQPTQPYPYYPHPQQTTQPQQVSNPQGFHRVMPTNHPPVGDTNTHTSRYQLWSPTQTTPHKQCYKLPLQR